MAVVSDEIISLVLTIEGQKEQLALARAEILRLSAALQRIADRDVEPELKHDANVLAGMAWAALNK